MEVYVVTGNMWGDTTVKGVFRTKTGAEDWIQEGDREYYDWRQTECGEEITFWTSWTNGETSYRIRRTEVKP